jgi:hypothetical protein
VSELTPAQKYAKAMHDHAKYVGYGHCGSWTCVECAR